MKTLEHCLKQPYAKTLNEFDIAEIKRKAGLFKEKGQNGHLAEISAIEEILDEVDQEIKDVEAQATKQGWKKPEQKRIFAPGITPGKKGNMLLRTKDGTVYETEDTFHAQAEDTLGLDLNTVVATGIIDVNGTEIWSNREPKKHPFIQPHDSIDAIYTQAKQTFGRLKSLTEKYARDYNGQAKFRPGDPLKDRVRAEKKIRTEEGGDFRKLTDVIATTITFDKVEDLYMALDGLKADKRVTVKVKDRFKNPLMDGYRDVLVKVKFDNGHVGEIQLTTNQMYWAKNEGPGYALYRIEREVAPFAETPPRVEADEDTNREAKKIYTEVIRVSKKLYDGVFSSKDIESAKSIASSFEITEELAKIWPMLSGSVISTRLESSTLKSAELLSTKGVPSLSKNLSATETSPPSERNIPQKEQKVKGIVSGNATKVYSSIAPKGVPVHYAIVEAKDVVTSHDPMSFAKNEKFPEGIQEREYDRDRTEQQKVIDHAEHLQTPWLLTNNPDAINGPPIIMKNGITLGGNSRAMSIMRAYDKGPKGQKYKAKLAQFANQFGLTSEQVNAMEQPILVRVTDEITEDTKELRRLMSVFNKPATQEMAAETKAVSMGKNVSQATMQRIGNMMAERDETIKGLLDRRESALTILDLLEKDAVISKTQRNKFWNAQRNMMNEDGKRLVEQSILGNVIDNADLLRDTPPFIMQKVGRSLADLSKIKGRGGKWDFIPDLNQALDLAINTKAMGGTVDEYLAQGSLLKRPDYSEKAITLAKALIDFKPKTWNDAVATYAKDAHADVAGQATMLIKFKTPEESFRDNFGEPGPARVEEAAPKYVQASLFEFKPAEEQPKQKKYPMSQRVVVSTTGNLLWSKTKVENPADVASLLATIRKYPQETFWIVTTDKDGNLLEVLKYTKGLKAAAMISASDVAGRVLNVKGASRAYFVHNHPSGTTEPSGADSDLATALWGLTTTGKVTPTSMVIGQGKFSVIDDRGVTVETGNIPPARRTVPVQVKERTKFYRLTKRADPVTNSTEALKARQEAGGTGNGVLLVDRRNHPIGFVPLEMGTTAREMTANLLRTIESTNASAGVMFVKGGQQVQYAQALVSGGLADFEILDVISDGQSLIEAGVRRTPRGDVKRLGAITAAETMMRAGTRMAGMARGEDVLEGHHTLPVAAGKGEKKLARLDWHLKNLWEGGYKTIKDIPRSEHVKRHASTLLRTLLRGTKGGWSPYELSPKQLRNAANATRYVYSYMKTAGAPQEVLDRIRVEAGPFIDLRGKNYQRSLDEWIAAGGNPNEIFGAATIYDTHAVIQLAMNMMNLSELETTAYHEWYHIAKRWLMTGKDAKAISGFFPGEEGRKGEAESFAKFAKKLRVEGIPNATGLKRLWMKLRRYLQILRNGLRGKGWTRPEDIFGKIYLGQYRPHFAPAEGETVLGAQTPYAPAFYSQMSSVLGKKLPNAGTVDQFRKMIDQWSKKGEFKADELKWSGLDDWLAGKAAEAPVEEKLQTTRGSSEYFDKLEKMEPSEGILSAEEAWAGGVADLGDKEAANIVQAMPGYFDYRSELETNARKHLGDRFTVWRATTKNNLDDWANGADIGPISVTTDRKVAESWHKVAKNEGKQLEVVEFEATPESIIMRGKLEESEVVIDGNEISYHTIKRQPQPISSQGRITKQEVLDFLKSNEVQIKEVTKGGPKVLKWQVYDDRGYRADDKIFDTKDEAIKFAKKLGYTEDNIKQLSMVGRTESELEGPTKFSQWQLPGGENYRELLLTLPAKPFSEEVRRAWWENAQRNDKIKVPYERLTEAQKRTIDERNIKEQYRSQHWAEPNVLAHVRFNERTGPNGEKILFLEEVQSDWHQAGRKKGYKREFTPEEKVEQRKLKDLAISGKITKEQNQRLIQLEDIGGMYGVPPAPFAKTWHELVMKRMLRYAAENGYDRVAWTTGEQQAERYDLSKHIDSITYTKTKGDNTGKGLHGEDFWDIHVTAKNGDKLAPRYLAADELEQHVGKELAEKIVNGPDTGEFKGLDLKVGGEGMKGFYDKIIPDFLNKYAKKWGARTEETQVGTIGTKEVGFDTKKEAEEWADKNLGDHAYHITEMPGMQFGIYDEYDHKIIKSKDSTSVHSLPVTDAMKESVLYQGQTMFEIPAFHGTRETNIDRFRTKYIGTGQGAKTFGWGLYFSSLKQIADTYATGRDYQVIAMNGLTPEQRLKAGEEVRAKLNELMPGYVTSGEKERAERDIAYYESNDLGFPRWLAQQPYNLDLTEILDKYAGPPKGKTYKVTIHKGKDPSQYDYLQWDKPLTTNQRNKIRNQLRKEGVTDYTGYSLYTTLNRRPMSPEKFSTRFPGEPELAKKEYRNYLKMFPLQMKEISNGMGVYQDLETFFMSDKEASLFLLRAGVDGIEYPAGTLSSVKESKARNYVVFDENAVTIEPEGETFARAGDDEFLLPTRYVRVAFTPEGGKQQRVFLSKVKETDKTISGYEVNKEGEEIVPKGYENRLRIIEKALVQSIEEYRMSKMYGTLEPLSAKQPDIMLRMGEKSEELLFVWRRNKEGGQVIGNREIIRKPTLSDFVNDILPRTEKGFYKGKTDTAKYKDFLSKYPNLRASYVDTGSGFQLSELKEKDQLFWDRIEKEEKGWVSKVESFDTPEAQSFRKTADSDLKVGKTFLRTGEVQDDNLRAYVQNSLNEIKTSKPKQTVQARKVERNVTDGEAVRAAYSERSVPDMMKPYKKADGTYDGRRFYKDTGIVIEGADSKDLNRWIRRLQTKQDQAKNYPEMRRLLDVQMRGQGATNAMSIDDRETTEDYYKLNKKAKEKVDEALFYGDQIQRNLGDKTLKDKFKLTDDEIKGFRALRSFYDKKRDLMAEFWLEHMVTPKEVEAILKKSNQSDYKALVKEAVAAINARNTGMIRESDKDKVQEEFKKKLETLGYDAAQIDKLSGEGGLADHIGKLRGYVPHQWDSEWRVYAETKAGSRYVFDLPDMKIMRHITAKGREAAAKNYAEQIVAKELGTNVQKIRVWQAKNIPMDLFEDVGFAKMQGIVNSAAENIAGEVRQEMGENVSKETLKDVMDKIQSSINEMWLAKGAGRHMIGRSNVFGYKKKDLAQITSSYANGMNAWYNKAIKAREFADVLRDINPRRTPEMWRDATEYVSDMLGESSEAGWFKRLAGLYYLAGDLSAATLNMTQNWTHAVALLRGIKPKEGKVTSEREIARAMKDVMLEFFSKKGQKGMFRGKSKFIETEALDAMNEAFRQGILDPQLFGEATGFHKNKVYQSYVQDIMQFPFKLFTASEGWNRMSTFLAAYRRATRAGEADPMRVAADLTNNSQFIYGRGNRPEIIRSLGALGNIMYTYMTYPINNLVFLKHRMEDLFKAASPEERRTAMKVIGSNLAYLFAFGGLNALPFAYLARFVQQLFDDPEDDWEKWLYQESMESEVLPESMKKAFARGVAKGIPAVLGNDFSWRVQGTDVIGAPIGLQTAKQIFYQKPATAIKQLQRGDAWHTIFFMMPDMLVNPYKAFFVEGGTGIEGKPPIKYTTGEAVTRALGFSPTRESEVRQAQDIARRKREQRLTKLENFAEKLVQIQKDPQRKGMTDLTKDIKEYNTKESAKGPEGLPIKWSDIVKSAKQREKARGKAYEARLPEYMRPFQKEMGKAYGLEK